VKRVFSRIWREDEGVLTFEWILLITVLVIGIVGGLSAVRDALITELGDVVEAVISLDQSYYIAHPWDVQVPDCVVDGASDSSYTDSAGIDQGRLSANDNLNDQGAIGDCGDDVEDPSL
jgi:Flp pilus assembly pilin Flp